MASIDVEFNRLMLRSTIQLVRELLPNIKLREASVLKMSGGGTNQYWLFEYRQTNGTIYSHETTASDAYEARSKGWHSYMAKHCPTYS